MNAVYDWFRSDIDEKGTPYRHCRGCDDASKPHTCHLCQRCLEPGHSHNDCKAEIVSVLPARDDLERATCSKAGERGHYQCGVCSTHNRARFICGCIEIKRTK